MLKGILGFLLGCCCLFFLTTSLALWQSCVLLIIAMALMAYAFGFIKTNKGHNNSTNQLIGHSTFFVACFLLGLLWVSIHAQWRLDQRLPMQKPFISIIEAKLVSIPVIYSDSIHFDALDLSSGKKLRLAWYQYEDFRVNNKSIEADNGSINKEALLDLPKLGQKWRFKVRLKSIYSSLNQAGFDREKHDFSQGVDARGTIQKNSAEWLSDSSIYSLSNIRQKLYDHLNDYQNAGIFQGLIVGEKGRLSDTQKKSIRSLGISHLMAISGLHIAIIAGLVLWLGQKVFSQFSGLSSRASPLTLAVLLSILGALFYSALAGFSIATIRAFLMWLAVSFSLLNSRHSSLWASLSFALLLILLWDPISVLSFGFWLTFAAVIIIGLFFQGRVFSDKPWKTALKLQLTISFGMALLGLALFQQFSLVAVLANLILIPLFSLLFLPLLFIFVLGAVLLGWSYGLQGLDYLLSQFFEGLNILTINNIEFISQWYLSPWLLLILGLFYLLLLLPIGKFKHIPLASLLALSLLMIAFKKQSDDFKLVVFDVGHGLASLIYNDNFAMLYDTGFANEHYSNAEFYLVPSLRKLGINKIDLLVISHQDLDHAGGYSAIKESFSVIEEVNQSTCYKGKKWSADGLELETIYGAANNNNLRSNNRSCVIKAQIGNESVLLTGDIEKEVELQLARLDSKNPTQSTSLSKLQSNILIAPHHGSNTSSTYPFIKMVKPEWVIHSTDRFNRYGMPHPKVKERYQEYEIKQLSTGCSGQITIKLTDLELVQARDAKRTWRNSPCRLP